MTPQDQVSWFFTRYFKTTLFHFQLIDRYCDSFPLKRPSLWVYPLLTGMVYECELVCKLELSLDFDRSPSVVVTTLIEFLNKCLSP